MTLCPKSEKGRGVELELECRSAWLTISPLNPIFYCQQALSAFIKCICVCVCKEDWPCANICCQCSSFCLRKSVTELMSVPIFFCFSGIPPLHGLTSEARSASRILTYKLQATKAACRNSTTTLPGQPPSWSTFKEFFFPNVNFHL